MSTYPYQTKWKTLKRKTDDRAVSQHQEKRKEEFLNQANPQSKNSCLVGKIVSTDRPEIVYLAFIITSHMHHKYAHATYMINIFICEISTNHSINHCIYLDR